MPRARSGSTQNGRYQRDLEWSGMKRKHATEGTPMGAQHSVGKHHKRRRAPGLAPCFVSLKILLVGGIPYRCLILMATGPSQCSKGKCLFHRPQGITEACENFLAPPESKKKKSYNDRSRGIPSQGWGSSPPVAVERPSALSPRGMGVGEDVVGNY